MLGGSLSIFRTFFNRQKIKNVISIPDTLRNALQTRRYEIISPALRAWCVASEYKPDRNLLLLELEQADYPSSDILKVQILVDFYLNCSEPASEQSRSFIQNYGFDQDVFVVLLISLYRLGRSKEALVELLAPGQIELLDGRADYWMAAALIFWATGRMQELRGAVEKMLGLAIDDTAVLENAWGMSIELGDEDVFRRIGELFETGRYRRGLPYALGLLALGDKVRGFKFLEERYDAENVEKFLNPALFGFPRWHGEDLAGRYLLLSAEQGLGDTVQMLRYLPLLMEKTQGHVCLETQPETISLIQDNIPELRVVERKYTQLPGIAFDCWIGMMSLPYLLNSENQVLKKAAYLRVPRESAEYWASRVSQLSTGRVKRVGLAWSGQPGHSADFRRSIPFETIMDFVRKVNAEFFTLQTMVPYGLPPNLVNVSDELLTLSDTAGLINEMDFVITVDTSIVHLAGALGKKTFLLLPYRYEWRWGLEGEGNDWYESVRVMRQCIHGAWRELLGRVFNEVFEQDEVM